MLGAHMIGAEVTELIQGFGLAKTLETTEAELMAAIFPHPALPEMMGESVLDAYGRVIHAWSVRRSATEGDNFAVTCCPISAAASLSGHKMRFAEEGGMSLSALLKDPRKLEERLASFEPSKEEIEGGLAALSYSNGVMTAAIVSPEHVPSSEWLPLIANPSDESWSGEDGQLAAAAMLLQHEEILKLLRSRDAEYEPFFWENDEGDVVTRDWAEGFFAAARLRRDAWLRREEREAQGFLGRVNVLLQDEAIDAKFTEAGVDPRMAFDIAVAELPDYIRTLYSIRKEEPRNLTLFQRSEKKAGRNEPCPCGSGKKYKKCCLN
jgi:yecA family protein